MADDDGENFCPRMSTATTDTDPPYRNAVGCCMAEHQRDRLAGRRIGRGAAEGVWTAKYPIQ